MPISDANERAIIVTTVLSKSPEIIESTLDLSSVRGEDGGLYVVTISNGADTRALTVTINVLGKIMHAIYYTVEWTLWYKPFCPF